MMKKLPLTLLFGFLTIFGYSQYHVNPTILGPEDPFPGNPGALNDLSEFPLGGGLDPSWNAILGPNVMMPSWSALQTVSFPFDFNGVPVTQYKVSSSGVLTFQTSAPTPPPGANGILPNPLIPDQSVCVWGLAGPGDNDYIVTRTFGSAPNRQDWIMFASYNGDGLNVACWHYYAIVLEETSNKIYIVDQRHTGAGGCAPSLTMGIQINGSSAVQVPGSPSVPVLAGGDASDGDNAYFEFIPGNRVNYNNRAILTNVPQFLKLGEAPFDIDLRFHNLGAQGLIAYNINYSIDGGTPVSSMITNVNVQPQTAAVGTSGTQWDPGATGEYTIKIWTTDLNGNADQLPDNDTITQTVQVVYDVFPRRALHEDFTSSSCPPCLPGGIQLRSVLDDNPDSTHTLISYAMSWPSTGDPYFTDEGGDRRAYYGVTGIPNLFIDGGWDGNPNSYDNSIFSSFQDIPALMKIDATYTIDSLAPQLKQIDVEVTITPGADFSSPTMFLHAGVIEYLTENNRSNANPNGETEWHHYMKKMLPDANGTVVQPLTANTPVTFNMSYFFAGDYRLPPDADDPTQVNSEHSVEEFTDLGVVVFVQDAATGEVFQSNYAEVKCNDIEIMAEGVVDSTTNQAYIKINSIEGGVGYSFELNGNAMAMTDSIGGLTPGSYDLVVTDGYGCSGSTHLQMWTTSVEDELEAGISNLSVFPNPNSGSFTVNVELKQADDLNIEVYNVNGSVLFSDKQSSTLSYHKDLNIGEDLPAGIYILKAETSNGVGYERIVVK